MKTLVVYFSRKGYVKRIAEDIAKKQNASLFEIKTTEKTDGILGFWWCGRFGMHRWGMKIENIEDISQYDKVVICSPVWVFSAAAPVWEFLNLNKGKIKSADYVLVHFSTPMKYKKTVEKMDRLLEIKHTTFTSVVCMWGKIFKNKKF